MSKYTVIFKTSAGDLYPRAFNFDIEEQKLFKYANITCQFFEEHTKFLPAKFTDIALIFENYGKPTEKKLFEGIIMDIPRRREGAIVTYEYAAVSKWNRAQNITVDKDYLNTTVSKIFKDLINTFAADTGISLGKVDDSNFVFKKISFVDQPLSECIDMLADASGFHLFIDENTRKIDFTRYTETMHYNGIFEDNTVKGTTNFTENVSDIVNKLIVYGTSNVKTTVKDEVSIAKYGLYSDILRVDNLSDIDDLKEVGNRHLEEFSKVQKTGSVDIIEDKGWAANNLINVNLPKVGIVNEVLRCTSIRRSYTKGGMTTTISFNEQPTIEDTMAQTVSKLKELEKNAARNSNNGITDDQLKTQMGKLMIDSDFAVKYDLTEEQMNRIVNDALLQKPIPHKPFTDTGQPGSGTINDPYYVRTAADLAKIMQRPNAFYRQVYDIDLTEYQENELSGLGWIPIGSDASPFLGSFDGDNHIISGLRIDRPNQDYVGLFGLVDGEIKNVHIRNAYVIGNNYCGLLVGGFKDGDSGTLFNCGATGRVEGAQVCGLVSGTSSSSNYRLYSTGDIIAAGGSAGGLFGLSYFNTTIMQSFSTANIEGLHTLAGIAIGGHVYDCWFGGKIFEKNTQNPAAMSSAHIGIGGTAQRCFSIGTIENINGDRGTRINPSNNVSELSFIDIQIADPKAYDPNHEYPRNSELQPTANMKNILLYYNPSDPYNYDFDKVWIMENGVDYPKLRWYTLLTTPPPEELQQ